MVNTRLIGRWRQPIRKSRVKARKPMFDLSCGRAAWILEEMGESCHQAALLRGALFCTYYLLHIVCQTRMAFFMKAGLVL